MIESECNASPRTILVGQGSNLAEHPLLLIFALMTIGALARLIVLQGKNMAPEKIVFEASAILLLATAAAAITRTGRSK